MASFQGFLLAALVSAAAPAGADDCIAMIGTGSVGGALGPRFAGLGERIVYGSRTPEAERIAALVERTGAGTRALAP